MDFLRKLLVLFIILITSYILYRAYKKRQKLLAGDMSEGFLGFGDLSDRELNGIRARAIPNTSITGISNTITKIPLCQYVIKSSYNTACSGNYFTTGAIEYVLSRGCRWLDFEVFYNAKRQDIFVSKTTDPSFNVSPKNSLSFMDAMSTVITYGTSSFVTNPTDPLFIQIRPKSFNANAYSMISATILSTFGNKLYGIFDNKNKYIPTRIDPLTTPLFDLKNRIIIVLDASPIKNMDSIAYSCTGANCNIFNIANITVGQTGRISKANYATKIKSPHVPYDVDFTQTVDLSKNPVVVDPPITTIKTYQQVVPDDDTRGNINTYLMIFYYGIQLTPGLFYYNDEELYNYEVLFENRRTAFLPLGFANQYIGTTSQFN